jgi:integrase
MAGKRLTALEVNRLKPGNYCDGDGLYLRVIGQSRTWAFRFKKAGKQHWLSLGSCKDYSLADARQKARECRRKQHEGVDLLTETVTARKIGAPVSKTFREAATAYISAHRAGWKNAKHAAQWQATLDQHAAAIMEMAVANVGVAEVIEVLWVIWKSKPETASRVRGRIEAVLDYAAARHWRTGDNPARWKGHLDALLPARSKVAAVEHHAALPWQDAAGFLTELGKRDADSVAALALRFAILTAARSGEVLGARWSEIDLTEAVWTVPAARMKAGKEHRVPLSAEALAVLRETALLRAGQNTEAFVFPGKRPNAGLSSMALAMVLRRMKREDLTVHGFRSTFRDWAGETTAFDHDTIEKALAHTVRDKTVAAYDRGDRFEKRRKLMEAWATFCATERAQGAVVTSIREKAFA